MYAVLTGFLIWCLAYVGFQFKYIPYIRLMCFVLRYRTSSLVMAHRVLYGACVVMFLMVATHLGLVMQQVSVDEIPDVNYRVQDIIATLEVCPIN
jgi:hypothetical protein